MTAYRAEIVAAATTHGLDPDLVEALVLVESAGQAHAYRYEPQFWARYLATDPLYQHRNPHRVAASYGLMQIMYVVAVEVGFTEADPEYLFVPHINLEFGCRKLRLLLLWAQEDVAQALCAYNGGRRGNQIRPFRNQAYADRVALAQATV